MRLRLAWTAAAGITALLGSSVAFAHLDVNYPPMRGGNQKVGPCEGVSFAGAPLTTVQPGSQITVDIVETIGHPGHYRIMFDADATDGEDFPDPVSCDDVGTPDGITLLADNLLPAQGGTCPGFHTPSQRTVASNVAYQFDVTLPDVECDNCVLQVIQVMTDASKADANGNWVPTGGQGLYFRCANLQLTRDGGAPSPDPDPAPPGGMLTGTCSAGGSGAGAGLVLIVGLAVALRRRRN